MTPIIKSFDSINRLYRKGVNICKGCERENNASCGGYCEANNFADCNRQAQRYAKEITALLAGRKDLKREERKRPGLSSSRII